MSIRAMKAGAVEFLTKPVRYQDLLDAIQLASRRTPPAATTNGPSSSFPPGAGTRSMIASRAGRLGSRRFRAEPPRCVALRPVRARNLALPSQLFGPLFPILRARQRREEGDEIVDLGFSQGEGLDVFVEIRVLQTVALVVVVNDIPQRLLRAAMKIRSGHQDVAYIGCPEGGNIGLFLGNQKAA
jgi:hypothetical protein